MAAMKTRLALPFLLAALALNACAPSHRENEQPSKEKLAAETQVFTSDDDGGGEIKGEVPTVAVDIMDGVEVDASADGAGAGADANSKTFKKEVPFSEEHDSVLLPKATGPIPIAKPKSDAGADTTVEAVNENDSTDSVASQQEQDAAASADVTAIGEAATAGDDEESDQEARGGNEPTLAEDTGENEEVAADDGSEPGAISSFEEGEDGERTAYVDQEDSESELQAAKKGGAKPAPKRATKSVTKIAAKPAAKGKVAAKPASKKSSAKPVSKKTAAKKSTAKLPAKRGAKTVTAKSASRGKAPAKTAPKKVARQAAPSADRSRITVGSITGSANSPKRNESTKFAPASITKLVTTGMALERLGHDFAFRNKIAWRLVQGSSATATNLTWLGEGDPTVGHPKFDVTPMSTLKKFAQSLKDRGIKSVQGPIVLRSADPRMNKWFVADGVPAWEPFVCYGAPPQAFNIFANCSQGLNGKAPAIRDTHTRAKQAFVAALKTAGISVNESARPAANPAVVSVMFRSAAMPKLLYWMNKRSDNLIAESLFKAVAKTLPGENLQTNGQSFYKSRVAQWLTQIGVPSFISDLNFLDGSGLTANNVVTPRAFVQMLKRYIPKAYFGDIWQSLPIAGTDGTLRSRMKNPTLMGKVRAKTGTLTGFYQLAGYIPRLNADNRSVKELVPFVILTKAPGNKTWAHAARAYQDEVLLDLARKVNGK